MPEVANGIREAGSKAAKGNVYENQELENTEISQVRKHRGNGSPCSSEGNAQVSLGNRRQPLSMWETSFGNRHREF